MAATTYKSMDGNTKLEYIYPKSPDQLKLFTKHGFVRGPKTVAVRYLEDMLTKTSLTTKKVTHDSIEKIGRQIHGVQLQQFARDRAAAVESAVEKTTEVMRRKQEQLFQQAAHKAALEREAMLMNQKNYYEELARRTKTGRDKMEEERMNKLISMKQKEKKEALEEQWKLAEKLKQEAIERVLAEQHKRLRATAAIEREEAIAASLRVARERFFFKLQEEINRTKKECEKIAKEVAERKEEIHRMEVERLNERIAALTAESNSRLVKQQNAQRDFLDIEEDYSRFLDFSASPCHSSFLVSPRKFKHGIAREQRSRASQTDLMAFHQRTVAVETDWQIIARR